MHLISDSSNLVTIFISVFYFTLWSFISISISLSKDLSPSKPLNTICRSCFRATCGLSTMVGWKTELFNIFSMYTSLQFPSATLRWNDHKREHPGAETSREGAETSRERSPRRRYRNQFVCKHRNKTVTVVTSVMQWNP